MEATFHDMVEGTGGFPITLVVSEEQFVILVYSDAGG